MTYALWRSQEDHWWNPDIGTRSFNDNVGFETHDVQDVRAMGYLLRKAANKVWKQPKRMNFVAGYKSEKSCTSDVEIQFEVCPPNFWPCFHLLFTHYDILAW